MILDQTTSKALKLGLVDRLDLEFKKKTSGISVSLYFSLRALSHSLLCTCCYISIAPHWVFLSSSRREHFRSEQGTCNL